MSLKVYLECYNSLHEPSYKPMPYIPFILKEFTFTLNPAWLGRQGGYDVPAFFGHFRFLQIHGKRRGRWPVSGKGSSIWFPPLFLYVRVYVGITEQEFSMVNL